MNKLQIEISKCPVFKFCFCVLVFSSGCFLGGCSKQEVCNAQLLDLPATAQWDDSADRSGTQETRETSSIKLTSETGKGSEIETENLQRALEIPDGADETVFKTLLGWWGHDIYKIKNLAVGEQEIAKLVSLAEDQNADASFVLARLYQSGLHVKQNDENFVKFLKRSAKLKHPVAELTLAYMYVNGRIVERDVGKGRQLYRFALRNFENAAEQGNAEAQFNLGHMHAVGEGVAVDDRVAVQWYRKAAEQGHDLAECNLGIAYANGAGVVKNDRVAVQWYRKAAEQGNVLAQFNLGQKYTFGEGVPRNHRVAAEHYFQAAEQGLAPAQFQLGLAHTRGDGVPKSIPAATEWFRKAAAQGHADAERILGLR